MRACAAMLLCAVVATVAWNPLAAQSWSHQVVKVTAKGDKPDASGKQVVTVTLDITPKFLLTANPPGNDLFEADATKVTVTGKNKPESVKIDYPVGEVVKEKLVGEYKVYKGKVTIKA